MAGIAAEGLLLWRTRCKLVRIPVWPTSLRRPIAWPAAAVSVEKLSKTGCGTNYLRKLLSRRGKKHWKRSEPGSPALHIPEGEKISKRKNEPKKKGERHDLLTWTQFPLLCSAKTLSLVDMIVGQWNFITRSLAAAPDLYRKPLAVINMSGKRKAEDLLPVDKRRRTSTLMANTFFLMRDIFIMEFLAHCDLLTIFVLAQTGEYARDLVKAFFSCNLRLLVVIFLGDIHINAFFQLLETSGSGIGGSTASSVLAYPYRHEWKPTNLNIFLPRGHMWMWTSFFASIGLSEAAKQPGVNAKHADSTFSFIVFESFTDNFSICLSESMDGALFSILSGATTTFATNLWTCSDVYILYMKLAIEKRALESWFPTSVLGAVKMHRRGFRSSISTTSWREPCGVNCPVNLCNVNEGFKDVGIFRWGGLSNQIVPDKPAGPHAPIIYIAVLPPSPPSIPATRCLHKFGVHVTSSFPEIDFTNNHPLSAAQRSKVAALSKVPYGPKWKSFLSSLDVIILFRFSLESAETFSVVMEYVRATQGELLNFSLQGRDSPTADAYTSIFSGLTLRDLMHLSWTSTKHHALFAREMQVALAALLSEFALEYTAVRFMQTATLTVIAGSTISHLLDPAVQPNNVDFYCPKPAYPWVGRFFEFATQHRPTKIVDGSHRFEGIVECLQWRRPDHSRPINLFRADSDSALDSLTYLPFSHMMAGVTHYGMWFAYPSSCTNRMTMPNRDLADVSTPGLRDSIASVVKKYMDRGYAFTFHLADPHVCGRAYECPVTPRTSLDDGCLQIFFPSPPIGCPPDAAHVYPIDKAVTWSLDGCACPTGSQALSYGIRPRANNNYVWWRTGLEKPSSVGSKRHFEFRPVGEYILFSFLMSIPLVVQFESEPSAFIAGTQYGTHCLPTRDRSMSNGSLFTFKDVDAEAEELPSDDERGRVPVYIAELFGRVQGVQDLDPGPAVGQITRLVLPPRISCRATDMYRLQTVALHDILHSDCVAEGGEIAGSWFISDLFNDYYEGAMHSFVVVLVHIYTPNWEHYLRIGNTVKMRVLMKRLDVWKPVSNCFLRDYSLLATDIAMVAAAELPRRAAPYGYQVNLSHFMHPLPLPSADPVEPLELVEALLKKYDFLIHTAAFGRTKTIQETGEFRATLLGCIARAPDFVDDGARRTVSYRLMLGCPDWSPLGWPSNSFLEIYKKQMETLRDLVYEQFSKWPRREPRVRWTDGGYIIVFLGADTHFWIPTPHDGPVLRPNDALVEGVTVVVDATLHCGWDHAIQAARVFSIEALHIQQVLGKYVLGRGDGVLASSD
ncbi:hypothetical protein C8R43DRAFT_947431 [Mycena crocata]|nr:hypothetical protein C8R43DRAFT_947431 [Mycena crocata]